MGNQLFWAMFDLAAFLKRVRLATCKPPENLPKAIEDLGEELQVSPWEAWMVIFLDRYRQRQLWALDSPPGPAVSRSPPGPTWKRSRA